MYNASFQKPFDEILLLHTLALERINQSALLTHSFLLHQMQRGPSVLHARADKSRSAAQSTRRGIALQALAGLCMCSSFEESRASFL